MLLRARGPHSTTPCDVQDSTEIVSYTSADNLRSQAVMARLGLQREPWRDFTAEYERVGLWRGLVWVARST